MAQYIDKSALVAEIERRINRNNEKAASYPSGSESDYLCRVKESVYKDLLFFINTLEVKDEQPKEQNRVICNYSKECAQEWVIEQLTAFAQHLNKRGAFRDDLCMDFEHEAQSFIELQKPKKL